MKPTDEMIEKFQRVYFEEFGEEISKQKAYEKFLGLANFLRVIFRPSARTDENTGKKAEYSTFGSK
jgi:hypothetical protein